MIFLRSTIRLFKGVPVKDASKVSSIADQASILKETTQHGFIIAPNVIANYSTAEIKEIVKIARDEIGLSGSQMNSSFHKSWNKVKDAPICQLVMEQMIHYLTTYGFERLGIYNKDTVYIPKEELNVPGLEEGFPLAVIKGYTRDEIANKVMALLSSGIALKEDTLKDVVNVAIYLEFDDEQLSKVKNKEARAMLYDYLDKIPSDPVEFLRFIVYKATNTTLLIKSDAIINAMKGSTIAHEGKIKPVTNIQLVKYFKKYDEDIGFKKLSSIFNRFKPLFLALKTNDALKHFVNQIAKLSKNHHVPMPVDYLNDVTAKLRKGIAIVLPELQAHLAKASAFRKARLAYALKFRVEEPSSIMYKIRNGTAYSTGFEFPGTVVLQPVLDAVIESIVSGLKAVEGKKIYIPGSLVHALPATEKQFTGDIPSGSYVDVKRDMIAGIHWKNVDDTRVDLDLSMMSVSAKMGWDGEYRTSDESILFSGDVTNAPGEGASECFYVKEQVPGNYILSVNYFNRSKDVMVPVSIFVATSGPVDYLPDNHVVDPNAVVCKAMTKMERAQKIIGLMSIGKDNTRFYFSETYLGNNRTIQMNEHTIHALGYLVSFYSNPISLNDILQKAGATIVSDPRKRGECDVDFSPEVITKETFVKLLADPASVFPAKKVPAAT